MNDKPVAAPVAPPACHALIARWRGETQRYCDIAADAPNTGQLPGAQSFHRGIALGRSLCAKELEAATRAAPVATEAPPQKAAPPAPASPRPAEVCICAAILTKEGTIIRGHRHDDCILTAGKMGLKPSSLMETQGFITSRNRFVDRYEAMRLQRAICATSAQYGELRGDILFSEDLY